MNMITVIQSEWEYVADMIPVDLDQSAYDHGALVRRRNVKCAGDLLRIAFCYSACDFSLRQTAVWAKMMGIADMSNVAVMKRLHRMDDWLRYLVMRWLQSEGLAAPDRDEVVHIVDGNAVCGPGTEGTDYRLHMGMDLDRQRIISADIMGADEGETLDRYEFSEGEIALADRGYCSRPAVARLLDSGAHIVLRINWHNFPLQARNGGDLDTLECLQVLLDVGEIGDWPVQFQTDDGTYDVRLIAVRKTQAAAEQQQKRLRRIASRKCRDVNPRALQAARFTYVITDLPPDKLPADEALELYRMRWQIEMAFRRLKSILHIDNLRAQKPEMARTYLYANMLVALIIDKMADVAKDFFPWGYPLAEKPPEPVAHCTNTVSRA